MKTSDFLRVIGGGLIAILFTACLDDKAKDLFISSSTSEEKPTTPNDTESKDNGATKQESVIINGKVVEYDSNKPFDYELVLSDNFESFNSKLWSRVPKGKEPWNKYMTSEREDLSIISNKELHLKGIKNTDKSSDNRNFLTGGVMTYNNLAMQYGKIEISAKLEDQKGAWPALWLNPQDAPNGWPNDGEIDIIERLNGDNFVYHVVHTKSKHRGDSGTYSKTATINPKNDFHIYTLEWTPKELVWKVDDKPTFTYTNSGNYDQFPFVKPFFIYMTMQFEGWPGPVEEATLPATMYIDYINIYAAYQEGKRITKFVRGEKELNESQVRALGN